MEVYAKLHREVSQFTYYKGNWMLEEGHLSGSCFDRGECYTGDLRWQDYTLEGTVMLISPGEMSLNVRVQGAIRSYAVAMDGKKLMIRKNENGYRTVASCDCEVALKTPCRLKIEVCGPAITVAVDGKQALQYTDAERPYVYGCIGCSVRGGARAWFSDLKIQVSKA